MMTPFPLRRCKAIGFGEEDRAALKQPAMGSLLVSPPWYRGAPSVSIGTYSGACIYQMHDMESAIAAVDRMLRLGASTRDGRHRHRGRVSRVSE